MVGFKEGERLRKRESLRWRDGDEDEAAGNYSPGAEPSFSAVSTNLFPLIEAS